MTTSTDDLIGLQQPLLMHMTTSTRISLEPRQHTAQAYADTLAIDAAPQVANKAATASTDDLIGLQQATC